MKYYYVYIILCSDGSYYVGMSNGVKKRFQEHQAGINPRCYTFKRRPLKLVYWERYDYVEDAILREDQLKGWRREKKEALINGKFEDLKGLSKNTTLRQKLDDPSTSSG